MALGFGVVAAIMRKLVGAARIGTPEQATRYRYIILSVIVALGGFAAFTVINALWAGTPVLGYVTLQSLIAPLSLFAAWLLARNGLCNAWTVALTGAVFGLGVPVAATCFTFTKPVWVGFFIGGAALDIVTLGALYVMCITLRAHFGTWELTVPATLAWALVIAATVVGASNPELIFMGPLFAFLYVLVYCFLFLWLGGADPKGPKAFNLLYALMFGATLLCLMPGVRIW